VTPRPTGGSLRAIRLAVLLAVPALSGCAGHPGLARLDAVVWEESSAEYATLTSSTYAAATRALRDAVASRPADAKPPAVIVDVDETVVMTWPHGFGLVKRNGEFDVDEWREWAGRAVAPAVPGAVDFLRAARNLGVRVFYITNRIVTLEDSTRANLDHIGVGPVGPDDVLMEAGRPEWTSDKTSRREWVARDFDVLVVVGDDLNDFLPAGGLTPDRRKEAAQAAAAKWGTEWFLLPNPAYGSWEKAIQAAGYPGTSTDSKLEYVRAHAP
jgi:5'-nucleotidase (lipoprotein e(P4) family)